MTKTSTSLKTKNALYLWTFISVNFALFLAIIIGPKLDYASVDHVWHRISTKDGLLVACMPLLTVVLNGVLGDIAKARVIFWRWKNPLPGCRAFSVLMQADPRINVAALKARHGTLPRSPKEQNVLWFQLYKKNSGEITVTESHRLYLLTRDMACISALFTLAFTGCSIFTSVPSRVAIGYSAALFIQYVILASVARNYGNRFVLNVLTEESHAK